MSNQPQKAGWSRPSVDYVNFLEMKNYIQKNEMKFKFLIFGEYILFTKLLFMLKNY